jgi:hypothetical protein
MPPPVLARRTALAAGLGLRAAGKPVATVRGESGLRPDLTAPPGDPCGVDGRAARALLRAASP